MMKLQSKDRAIRSHIHCNFQLPLLREAQERRELELHPSIQSLAQMVQTLNESDFS